MTRTTSHDPWLDLVQRRYGIVGTPESLPGYADTNIRLTTTDGASFVLRVSPPPIDEDRLDFIASVLAASAATSFSTPTLVPTIDGSHHVVATDGHVLRLFRWLEGNTYEDSGPHQGLPRAIGEAAAEMVVSLAPVMQPTEHRVRLWDLRYADETISERFGLLGTDHERYLVAEVLDRYRRLDRTSLPEQVVHNDINPGNLLVEGSRVVGLLDFGDTTKTYRIAELAIAAAYAALDVDDPVATIVEVCSGYGTHVDGTVHEPTEAEALALPDLILTRLATSVAVAAERTSANPHWHTTRDSTWDLLGRFVAGDLDAITATISAAIVGKPAPTPKAVRRPMIGSALSLAYDEPLTITSGRGAHLSDSLGRRYLDAVNNVAHVGHGNPVVVRAGAIAMASLNTNTRYLHPELPRFAERLAATLPDRLDTVFVVNSGSEANELAIRLARTVTGRRDFICVEHGYHGNTSTLIDISPYKHDGPGGSGRPHWVSVLPALDPYRNTDLGGDRAVDIYGAAAERVLDGTNPAGLIIEALPGCGGQIVPSAGALSAAYAAAHGAGAVVIADEVQTGLGRVGDRFWAFELFDVSPDIVTIGKPVGNGHPLAAVVTTRAIADAFDNGMEYFNTFGGNPVSAAVGNAVLDVIETEGLQQHARSVGQSLIEGLRAISTGHNAIGDVRGAGLFIGIDLVTDRATKEPDGPLAHAVVQAAKRSGVLLSTDGPGHNVIKIKPPLVFTERDGHTLIDVLDRVLSDLAD